MKKFNALAIIAVFAMVGCENEEISTTLEQVDTGLDTELVVEQETTAVEEEIEIEELEAIQSQFLNEIENLDFLKSENLSLAPLDFENSELVSEEDMSLGHYKKKKRRKITSLCLVKDADRCPFSDRQPSANLWWPENETDFFVPSAYFSSTKYHRMIFVTFNDGTALIRGTTSMNDGKCKVYVNAWLKDKRTYDEFTAIGGEFKLEPGCASQEAVPGDLLYYEMDSKRSWLYSWGSDCLGTGCFGLEQRGENLRGQLGPNGAGFDSNIGAHGFSNWGWIIDKHTHERLWVMDFDFRLRCCPRYH